MKSIIGLEVYRSDPAHSNLAVALIADSAIVQFYPLDHRTRLKRVETY
jgi:hypothetical protein